jgi:probable F420-dependent oxidoreductase
MKFGVAIFPTEYTPTPAEVARMAEERGIESLFFPEHTHIPASRASPYPAGGELPKEYSHLYDPFLAAMSAADATDRLLVGTGVCLVIQHDPIVTAKEVASLDRLSDGRFLFGVGAGWNEEEMRDHGTDPRRRFKVMRERIEAMKAIWTEDEASYAGEFVTFERIWSWPKPLQKPHPPILVGGTGPKVLDRVLAYGDEWMPNRVRDHDELLRRVKELFERAQAAGRQVAVTITGATRDPERIEQYERGGIHRCVYWLPAAGPDEVEAGFDRVAQARDAYASAGG